MCKHCVDLLGIYVPDAGGAGQNDPEIAMETLLLCSTGNRVRTEGVGRAVWPKASTESLEDLLGGINRVAFGARNRRLSPLRVRGWQQGPPSRQG